MIIGAVLSLVMFFTSKNEVQPVYHEVGVHLYILQWNLSNPAHQGTMEMCQNCTGCQNTPVLF